MTTKLKLYNRALGHLGVTRLANLTEAVKPRYELDEVYDDTIAAVLEKAGWKCALRTSQLDYDTNISPTFGMPYAIGKPTDYVRMVNFSSDPNFGPEGEISDYQDDGAIWYTNHQTVFIRYVSNGASYGGDLALWPQRLADYAAFELALRSGIPITKDRGDRNDMIALSEKKLAEAKGLDAIGEPVKRRPMGTLVQSRFSRRGVRPEPMRS